MAGDGFADQCIDILPAADVGFLERPSPEAYVVSAYEIRVGSTALGGFAHDIGIWRTSLRKPTSAAGRMSMH